MFAMDLIDSSERETSYGILLCNNDNISQSDIQNKIVEIKESYNERDYDWFINDVINAIPKEWEVFLQEKKEHTVLI